MPRPTPLSALGVLLIIMAAGFIGFGAVVEGDFRPLALPIGVALLVLPSLVLKRFQGVRVEVWQLLVIRFVCVGPGTGVAAFGLGAQPLAALAIGIVAGVAWAALRFVARPKD